MTDKAAILWLLFTFDSLSLFIWPLSCYMQTVWPLSRRQALITKVFRFYGLPSV